jgi:hypothetical protein
LDAGPQGELEGPAPAEVSCTLKEGAIPDAAADVTLPGSANVSKEMANTSSRAHSLHASLREGVSMRASMGEAVHVMLETSRELSSVVLGDGDAPVEVRKDKARRITADLQGLMSQLRAEHDEVVQQVRCCCIDQSHWRCVPCGGGVEIEDCLLFPCAVLLVLDGGVPMCLGFVAALHGSRFDYVPNPETSKLESEPLTKKKPQSCRRSA